MQVELNYFEAIQLIAAAESRIATFRAHQAHGIADIEFVIRDTSSAVARVRAAFEVPIEAILHNEDDAADRLYAAIVRNLDMDALEAVAREMRATEAADPMTMAKAEHDRLAGAA